MPHRKPTSPTPAATQPAKQEPHPPETVEASEASEATESTDPFAARRERARAAVEADLRRFAQRRWQVAYAGDATIIATARALLLSALFTEHAACPHCGGDTGVRLSQSEAEARFLEMQHLLLDREYQDACVQADIQALSGGSGGTSGRRPAAPTPIAPARRAAAKAMPKAMPKAMQPPAPESVPEVQVEGANAPVRIYTLPPQQQQPIPLSRAQRRRRRA